MKQKKIIWNLKSPPKRKSNSFLRKQNKDQSLKSSCKVFKAAIINMTIIPSRVKEYALLINRKTMILSEKWEI